MAIQLEPTTIAAQTAAAMMQNEAPLAKTDKTAPVLGGENVKVTSAATTDLEKLVASLKNESDAVRQSVSQRRTAILSTVLDSMADKITAAEKENLLKMQELEVEKGKYQKELAVYNGSKAAMEALIDSLDKQIEQAVQDGAEHREQVEKLKKQRSEEQAKLDGINASIKSVTAKIAGVDTKIAECSKAIASSTLTEVYAALRAATGDDNSGTEVAETHADREKQEAKNVAFDIALHISAALDKLDGQIRAALDEAQMKVVG